MKRAIKISLIITSVAIAYPYVIGWMTNQPYHTTAKLPIWGQFLLMWVITAPLFYSLNRLYSFWNNIHDAYEHNKHYGYDCDGEILHEGDWVDVYVMTGAGGFRTQQQIIKDNGFLAVKTVHGITHLKYFNHNSVNSISKIKNK